MIRADSDHVNWILIVILVALALLLAMVSSTATSACLPGDRSAIPGGAVSPFREFTREHGKEVRAPAEIWCSARELVYAGRFAEARQAFEQVEAALPGDRAARMWAAIAAFRAGDRPAAMRRWEVACASAEDSAEPDIWPAIALAAAYLESGRVAEAAALILPLERADSTLEPPAAIQPIVSFYAALVYEQLAKAAPHYRDAIEQSGRDGNELSPPLASSDAGLMVSPNSQSWLIFLTKQALLRAIAGARSTDWAAPVVPESATVEPSLAPTVEDLLRAIGSADFAAQAHGKLRALQLYESPPKRKFERFDDPDVIKRGRFLA